MREEVNKLCNDFYLIASKVINEATKGEGLKILTSKQMLGRLPIALAQIKADNTSENSLNEIKQIVCSLYRVKEIAKKVYNKIDLRKG